MKSVYGKFSLREILEIVVPGVYFTLILNPLLIDNKYSEISSIESTELIISFVLSILVGIIIYSIDIPKRLWFFKNNLPTSLIKRDTNLKDISEIHNKYFDFYDENIKKEQKAITEKYTNLYHFCGNIALVSTLNLIIYAIYYWDNFFKSYGKIILIILVLSILGMYLIFYGERKVKYMFNRQYKKFKNFYEQNQESNT